MSFFHVDVDLSSRRHSSYGRLWTHHYHVVFSNGFQVSSNHRAFCHLKIVHPLEVKIPISATWSTLENFSGWKDGCGEQGVLEKKLT